MTYSSFLLQVVFSSFHNSQVLQVIQYYHFYVKQNYCITSDSIHCLLYLEDRDSADDCHPVVKRKPKNMCAASVSGITLNSQLMTACDRSVVRNQETDRQMDNQMNGEGHEPCPGLLMSYCCLLIVSFLIYVLCSQSNTQTLCDGRVLLLIKK